MSFANQIFFFFFQVSSFMGIIRVLLFKIYGCHLLKSSAICGNLEARSYRIVFLPFTFLLLILVFYCG